MYNCSSCNKPLSYINHDYLQTEGLRFWCLECWDKLPCNKSSPAGWHRADSYPDSEGLALDMVSGLVRRFY